MFPSRVSAGNWLHCRRRYNWLALSLLGLLMVASCSSPRQYIAAADYVRQGQDQQPLRLRAGDRLQVLVSGQEALSTEVDVRLGGEIVLPVAGSLTAADKTPTELANAIARKLTGMIAEPVVTVIVTNRRTQVTIIGEVRSPGRYDLGTQDGVLNALAQAGGLTPFAEHDCVFVLRHQPRLARIRFDYDDLTGADKELMSFQLRDGDIIVAE
jgi:polysaccharide export outer membrane protein